MSGSTIPDTLDRLQTVFDGAAVTTPSLLTVCYGPAFDTGGFFLAVGWDRSDQPAVVARNVRDDAAGARGQEAYDVSCLLSLALGNQPLPVVCRDVFAAFDLLAAALKADVTLGRTVLKTWITEYEMTPLVVESIDVIDIRFTVSVAAVK